MPLPVLLRSEFLVQLCESATNVLHVIQHPHVIIIFFFFTPTKYICSTVCQISHLFYLLFFNAVLVQIPNLVRIYNLQM